MKKCKYCGKEFKSTPIYCIRCGASEDFLIRKTKKTDSDYSNENKIESYDELAREFLGDENIKKDKWAVKENRLAQTLDEEQEEEYYSFLEKKLGDEFLNNKFKNKYYGTSGNIFEQTTLCSTEQTTFNGIFNKQDTVENTFFNRKNKVGRWAPNKKIKIQRKKYYNISDDPTIKITTKIKKNKKTNKKLWKIFFGLVGLLGLVIIVMLILINNIVNINDTKAPLPTEEFAMSLFTDIQKIDEPSFLKNPQNLYIPNYIDIEKETNQFYLKALYGLINAKDYEIKSVKKIEAKGDSRAVLTYEVTKNSLSSKVFESLIFRDVGNGNFKLDFEDFILRYDRLKSTK